MSKALPTAGYYSKTLQVRLQVVCKAEGPCVSLHNTSRISRIKTSFLGHRKAMQCCLRRTHMWRFHRQHFLESLTQGCCIKRSMDNLAVPRGCRDEAPVKAEENWSHGLLFFSEFLTCQILRGNKSGIFIQCCELGQSKGNPKPYLWQWPTKATKTESTWTETMSSEASMGTSAIPQSGQVLKEDLHSFVVCNSSQQPLLP